LLFGRFYGFALSFVLVSGRSSLEQASHGIDGIADRRLQIALSVLRAGFAELSTERLMDIEQSMNWRLAWIFDRVIQMLAEKHGKTLLQGLTKASTELRVTRGGKPTSRYQGRKWPTYIHTRNKTKGSPRKVFELKSQLSVPFPIGQKCGQHTVLRGYLLYEIGTLHIRERQARALA
jgi:hypothetical protein